MIPQKGLSHYQSVQARVAEDENRRILDIIAQKGTLYNIPFLQNKALMESILSVPDETLSEKEVEALSKLLLWLEKTQEGATLS